MSIKLPLADGLNATLDMLRLRVDVTDAVVILINQRTGEVKAGSLRGDFSHMHEIISKSLAALNKQKARRAGIITF